MDVVDEVKVKLGRFKIMEYCPTWREMYHKELKKVDLDRSSLNEKYPSSIRLGFMQFRTKWTQKSR